MIVDINTAFVENVYAKAWAEYVVSVLNSNKDLSLSVDGYKKAYNSYCEREYAKALLRAEEELNKNSL